MKTKYQIKNNLHFVNVHLPNVLATLKINKSSSSLGYQNLCELNEQHANISTNTEAAINFWKRMRNRFAACAAYT